MNFAPRALTRHVWQPTPNAQLIYNVRIGSSIKKSYWSRCRSFSIVRPYSISDSLREKIYVGDFKVTDQFILKCNTDHSGTLQP